MGCETLYKCDEGLVPNRTIQHKLLESMEWMLTYANQHQPFSINQFKHTLDHLLVDLTNK